MTDPIAIHRENSGQAADILRAQAFNLLKKAESIDGKLFYSVVHAHEYGNSSYMLLSKTEPTEEQAAAILDAPFEPEKNESLLIDSLNVHQLFGIKDSAQIKTAG